MYSKVYVEITNVCNMNCSFCHGHHRTKQSMSFNEFSSVLEQLHGKTNYIYYHLMGEPLTHPELPSFLKLAKERGFHSILTTNGTLLNKRGEEIIRAGVHKVSISVHSFEDCNDTEFTNYMNSVIAFAECASKAGIIVVFRLWNKGHDNGLNDRVYSLLKNEIPGEWVENTRGIRIHNKLHLEWGERFVWPDMDVEEHGDCVYCYGLKDHFGVLVDGTVVPCCMDSEGIIHLGNIFRDDLDEILNSPRATAIKDGFLNHRANETLCKKCGYATRFR